MGNIAALADTLSVILAIIVKEKYYKMYIVGNIAANITMDPCERGYCDLLSLSKALLWIELGLSEAYILGNILA